MALRKLSNEPEQVHGRWYGDGCGMAMALEVLGERWSLPIVRELLLGPRRFSELRADLPGISARVLTERLNGLAETGLLQKVTLPSTVGVEAYELTQWGQQAEPIIREMALWAMRSDLHDETLPISASAFALTLPMTFDPSRGADSRGSTLGLEIGQHRFIAWVTGATVIVRRGDTSTQDVIVRAESGNAMFALFYARMPFVAWAAAGEDRAIMGKAEDLSRLIAALSWPEKAAA
ncbi:winged helix-turn-helix transcriptional regulator [Aurantiacibacter suaedae]|uniref:winged helix-turn-helix transcriptional regulator n=1 Tax=Aurantiacibacter suaedae TaxID=2545755 RepID=UPI0010F5D973|nr:helix-turn-helix domain-containing protein [Aurantiacibacter suaedae]